MGVTHVNRKDLNLKSFVSFTLPKVQLNEAEQSFILQGAAC